MKLCYVTQFIDIKREKWNHFRRSSDEYFQQFLPILDMFLKHSEASHYDLVIFIDDKHAQHLPKELTPNVHVVPINEEYLCRRSPLWNRLDRERQIMESIVYRYVIEHRIHHPEHSNPLYTLATHAKVDAVYDAMKIVPDATHYAWVDFGYCKTKEVVPRHFLDLGRTDPTRVNFALVNPIDDNDRNVIYTLKCAPDKITGSFFCGPKDALVKYRELYLHIHDALQKHNVVDDDQHITLQCVFARPDLFALHHLGGFHKSLTAFEKSK